MTPDLYKAQPGIQRLQWDTFGMIFLFLDEEIMSLGLEQRGWPPFLYITSPSTQHRIPRHYTSFSPGDLGEVWGGRLCENRSL